MSDPYRSRVGSPPSLDGAPRLVLMDFLRAEPSRDAPGRVYGLPRTVADVRAIPSAAMTDDRSRDRGSRFGRLLSAVGCLVILVVIGLLVAGAYFLDQLGRDVLATPGDTVDRYVERIRDHDQRGAYELLCDDLRGEMTQAAFGRRVEAELDGLGPILRVESQETIPRALDRFSVYRRFVGTARSRTFEFTVVRESDTWRICGWEP
jgi:hypothetical protein